MQISTKTLIDGELIDIEDDEAGTITHIAEFLCEDGELLSDDFSNAIGIKLPEHYTVALDESHTGANIININTDEVELVEQLTNYMGVDFVTLAIVLDKKFDTSAMRKAAGLSMFYDDVIIDIGDSLVFLIDPL